MDTDNRLQDIKQRLAENAYFINPHSDANVKEDLAYLLTLLEEQQKKMESLEKKNRVLSDHVAELTQEIENVRSDFGNQR